MSEQVTMTKAELKALLKEAVEESKKSEPGIISNFYFGAKAGVKGLANKVEDATKRFNDAAERERLLTEKMKVMEETIKDLERSMRKPS